MVTLKLTEKEARAVYDELHRIFPRGVHWSAANMAPVLSALPKLYDAIETATGEPPRQ